jgi:transposase
MIKSRQITELKGVDDVDYYYITAITKPQIEKLIKESIFQMELFDENLCEVDHEEVRYVLRRNPLRAQEIAGNRKERKESVATLCQKKCTYLSEHPRAKVETAFRDVNKKISRLKLSGWLEVEADGRKLELKENKEALEKQSRLDGCYVIKTDLPEAVDKQIVHNRYKDLAKIEQAFRTSKTGLLEMRPWFVRTETSTRGHALVVMLAYLLTHYLQQAWSAFDLTVEEGLNQLSTLCSMEMLIKDGGSVHRIPTPREASAQLLKAANVRLPRVLPHLGARVVTRKKLQSRRKPSEITKI